jgi:hypothetical protein
MGTTRGSRRLLAGLVLTMGSLLVAPLAAPAGAAAPDQADAFEVFTRDVFVLAGASLVNPDEETDPSATLYNVAGLDLGITWGEWAGAAVTSTARAAGDRTDVRLELSGLVPNGLYSVFWGTIGPDSENPLCPGVERTLPLTAFPAAHQNQDPSSFVAGGDGSAEYRGRVDGALLDASQVFFTIIYHSDGMSYGPLPNRGEWFTQGENCRSSFGLDALRQVLVLQKW